MNNENNTVDKTSTDNSQAISDLIQSLQAKMEVNNDTTNTENLNTNINTSPSNNFDLSSILGMLGTNQTTTEKKNDSSNFSGFDPSLLLKIQKVMSSVSKNDPKKNLLLSLKPFLRKSRQDKLNEYISMLTIISALEAFGDKGSDKNV